MYNDAALNLQRSLVTSRDVGRVVWTDSMWRLYFLVERCYRLHEPVLLVGETGGGKTTVCQLLSIALGSKLHILNCHQYTETSDFLGGFYPVRERSELGLDYKSLCEQLIDSKPYKHFPHDTAISLDINQASKTLNQVTKMIKYYREVQVLHPDVTLDEVNFAEEIGKRLSLLHQKWCTIFTWQYGTLVQAMKNGDLFLVDEVSLADDSVLERLNSVLEPERKLMGTGISKIEADDLRERCLSFLMEQLKESKLILNQANLLTTENYGWSDLLSSAEALSSNGMEIDSSFGINPFYVEKGGNRLDAKGFEFLAPTTRRNSLRVLRAMQLKKPVLLEGSPGVGKTSLVLALGKFSGHTVVRINLLEQTDMMDLLGSDFKKPKHHLCNSLLHIRQQHNGWN